MRATEASSFLLSVCNFIIEEFCNLSESSDYGWLVTLKTRVIELKEKAVSLFCFLFSPSVPLVIGLP